MSMLVCYSAEGDENSKLFHSYVKRRNNKNNIRCLMINGVWCEDPTVIKSEIMRHYKELFMKRSTSRPIFCCERIHKISREEAALLEKEFSEVEIGSGSEFDWTGDFRPISLIGCYYKIISKILAERIKKVVGTVVGDVQNAFIKDKYIMDGILIANESIEGKGLIFKVDFEKAYDSINWRFLLDIMKRMGLGVKWCKWIESCLKSATMSVLVNGSPTEEFCLERGVRQGDPLSPSLFILAAEDDTIFFGEWSKENARSLMCILKCFKKCPGFGNYNKSKLYGVGVNDVEIGEMVGMEEEDEDG
ncbi:reverse transcriptase domain, reverse transcriptase zinc-binding domain protein [Tanacetum coccineum]